jgi:glycosyltransferase involved in cell wall biosynthesis
MASVNISVANPIISVIIPCYNHGMFIEEALKSIEESERKDYEIIIIDDGSTDSETISKLEHLKSKGYQIISQMNMGAMSARNNGIRNSRGKYILPLDADNMIMPQMISKTIKILESDPSVSIVYSDRKMFGIINEINKVGPFILSEMLLGNYIDACAVYRREVWEKTGGYDENMQMQGWEDWDFWLSAFSNGYIFEYISEVLFQYRVSEESAITRLMDSPRLSEVKAYLFKKHSCLLYQEYVEINRLLYECKKKLSEFEFNEQNLIRSSIKYFYKWIHYCLVKVLRKPNNKSGFIKL